MRERVLQRLKEQFVPELRSAGFKGSMPHFYRVHDDGHIDLLTVQFSSSAGAFSVDCSYARSDRSNVGGVGKDLPPHKLRVAHIGVKSRYRLCPEDYSGDYWFMYSGPSTGPGFAGSIKQLVAVAVHLFRSQALIWFKNEAWGSGRQ